MLALIERNDLATRYQTREVDSSPELHLSPRLGSRQHPGLPGTAEPERWYAYLHQIRRNTQSGCAPGHLVAPNSSLSDATSYSETARDLFALVPTSSFVGAIFQAANTSPPS